MTGRCLKKLIGGDLHLLFEYNKVVRGHSKNVRQAKMQSTAAAQKFINNKNAALWLQLLLYANFNVKNACFCTFTFNEENLPVNRKMAHQYFTSFIRSMRRQWKKNGRAFPYIYTLEGASLRLIPPSLFCVLNYYHQRIRKSFGTVQGSFLFSLILSLKKHRKGVVL